MPAAVVVDVSAIEASPAHAELADGSRAVGMVDDDCTENDKPGCRLATHRCEECSKDEHCGNNGTCNVAEGKCN